MSINVKPNTHGTSVPVKTVVVAEGNNRTHYPVYMLADSEGNLIDGTNPTPISIESSEVIRQEEVIDQLQEVVKQLKIMNIHLQAMTGERLNGEDI